MEFNHYWIYYIRSNILYKNILSFTSIKKDFLTKHKILLAFIVIYIFLQSDDGTHCPCYIYQNHGRHLFQIHGAKLFYWGFSVLWLLLQHRGFFVCPCKRQIHYSLPTCLYTHPKKTVLRMTFSIYFHIKTSQVWQEFKCMGYKNILFFE